MKRSGPDHDGGNVHEARARGMKAFDLARALEGHLPGTDRVALAALARGLDGGTWARVAEEAGIRAPSAATVAAAVGILEAWAAEAGRDPFEGLA